MLDPRGPRALVDYELRRLPAFVTDVLVVGSGVAGLTAALEAARGRDVLVIAKGSILETNTACAQGGIAAVLGADDSVASHRDDTLSVGQGLCEADVVETVTSRGPEAVRRLVSLGAHFDRLPDGTFDLSREGGHSRPRVVHAQGDLTGPTIESALAARVRSHPRIGVFEHTFVIDLITDDAGACVGALAWRRDSGLLVLGAPRTILATGGAGQLYRETTNPEIATADGVAMAFRAGAAVRDAEFVQFHPTTLYVAGAARLLISEVVRGKGAVLVDRTGTPFLRDYHPDGDLAPRDV
ncbi:MAG TPA: FAD-dependent oxidoreductase, partial [Planctomycetota bacterium]|nr:FAD-dependent oxidoreductase [Planctomycetota bacterium]